MKLPQLRILATNYCGRRCIYCRPSGECAENIENKCIDLNLVVKIAKLYKKHGGQEIKITGGDPLYWDNIVECVRILKEEIQIENVELITRSPRITEKIDDLIACGLDILNFSLDTVDREKFYKITAVNDFDLLESAIKYCSEKSVELKLNTVVMKGINDNEIDKIVDFCNEMKFKQVKLLDMISDLHNTDNNNSEFLEKCYGMQLQDLYIPLEQVTQNVKENAVSSEIIYQGGLGHPMNRYIMKNGLEVIVKDSNNGAWYGEVCKGCNFFSCHDALMALRLTNNEKLQFCLLRDDNCVDLHNIQDNELEEVFESALNIYKNSYFIDVNEDKRQVVSHR